MIDAKLNNRSDAPSDRAATALPNGYRPSDLEVASLIAEAARHPLGTAFLIEGHLGTVAITFRTHAFTVDAARRRLTGRAEVRQ